MKRALLFVSTLSLATAIVTGTIKWKNNVVNIVYKNLYVLGDSLSDTGVLTAGVSAIMKDMHFKHGITFEPPFYEHHSFSNGPVAAQVLAQKLNLPLNAGWDFQFLNHHYHQIGTNYACGGAQATKLEGWDQLTGIILNNFTINNQVSALLAQHQIKSNDLTFFEIGSNDLFTQVFTSSDDYVEWWINKIISEEKSALQRLIQNGAQHIIVMNSPDLSLIPQYRGGSNFKRIAKITKGYNEQWDAMISTLQQDFPHYLKVFNLYSVFDQLLHDFSVVPGNNVKSGAVNYALDLKEILLDGKVIPKYNPGVNNSNINQHFFFDNVHPTASIHKKVGELLYNLATKPW